MRIGMPSFPSDKIHSPESISQFYTLETASVFLILFVRFVSTDLSLENYRALEFSAVFPTFSLIRKMHCDGAEKRGKGEGGVRIACNIYKSYRTLKRFVGDVLKLFITYTLYDLVKNTKRPWCWMRICYSKCRTFCRKNWNDILQEIFFPVLWLYLR